MGVLDITTVISILIQFSEFECLNLIPRIYN